MPSINVNIQPGAGPLLSVVVGVSTPRASALHATGQPIPTPVMGTFLVDTGASATVIDPDLIQSLGLQPTGRAGFSTPSTPAGSFHYCDQYDVSLFILGNGRTGGHIVEAIPIFTTHLRSQRIDGLIGRDILNECVLIYNGSASMFTLNY